MPPSNSPENCSKEQNRSTNSAQESVSHREAPASEGANFNDQVSDRSRFPAYALGETVQPGDQDVAHPEQDAISATEPTVAGLVGAHTTRRPAPAYKDQVYSSIGSQAASTSRSTYTEPQVVDAYATSSDPSTLLPSSCKDQVLNAFVQSPRSPPRHQAGAHVASSSGIPQSATKAAFKSNNRNLSQQIVGAHATSSDSSTDNSLPTFKDQVLGTPVPPPGSPPRHQAGAHAVNCNGIPQSATIAAFKSLRRNLSQQARPGSVVFSPSSGEGSCSEPQSALAPPFMSSTVCNSSCTRTGGESDSTTVTITTSLESRSDGQACERGEETEGSESSYPSTSLTPSASDIEYSGEIMVEAQLVRESTDRNSDLLRAVVVKDNEERNKKRFRMIMGGLLVGLVAVVAIVGGVVGSQQAKSTVAVPTPAPTNALDCSTFGCIIFVNAGVDDDAYITGNSWGSGFADAIDVTAAEDYPAVIFTDHRSGDSGFFYTLPGLDAGANYEVIMGFAENWSGACSEGDRVQSVLVNGRAFLRSLDLIVEAGECYKAIVETGVFAANDNGEIVITFTSTVGNPLISFLEVKIPPEGATATPRAAATPTPAPTQISTLLEDNKAILEVQGEDGVDPRWWTDSYSVGDRCYCDTIFDHGVGSTIVNTAIGNMTVQEACEMIGPGPGKAGRPVYNDVQCGNGPANGAGDEVTCPGRTDHGRNGCGYIGPKWNFSDLSSGPTEEEPCVDEMNFFRDPTARIFRNCAWLEERKDSDDIFEAFCGVDGPANSICHKTCGSCG